RKNCQTALLLCAFGLLLINGSATLWNHYMPAGLHLEAGIVLAIISLGWFMERIATLIAQLQMSLKNYQIAWAYVTYIALGIVGVLSAWTFESTLVYSSILTL